MLGFLGSPLPQTSWPPLMEVPNRPPPLCSLLKSNLSCAWFPTALLLAFQKRVSIYMKLSNTIFRSKFDEDDDEERLLIDELLPQGKENLFENAIFRSKFDEDDDEERLLIDELFPLNIMLLGKSLIMQLNRCIFLHFQNFLWLVSYPKEKKTRGGSWQGALLWPGS